MSTLGLANPRLEHFYRTGGHCAACQDQAQQQVTNWLVQPAEWRCRLCRRRYAYEPAGAPSVAEANAAVDALFRLSSRMSP